MALKKTSKPPLISQISGTSDKGVQEKQRKLSAEHDREFARCARDLFYFLQFCRTDDEDVKEIREFPVNYEYLHKVNKSIEDNQKTIILKSRRLMISWLGMLRLMHQALFAGSPAGHQVFLGGVASVGETEAQYLITRITNVHHRLPEWIKLRNPLITDNKMYMEWRNGGKIQAFACKREGPQTFGFSEFFFDEMALQEAARTTWTGLIPTLGASGKVLAVSTPNGKANFFYDIWKNDENQFRGMNRLTIHWTENPEHGEEWFKKTTDGLNKQQIARMFELSFAVYAGKPVWDLFEYKTHVWDVEKEGALIVSPERPVYHGWDLGYHNPAWTLWQLNSKDQWCGIDELLGFDIEFRPFAEKVRERCAALYDRKKVLERMCIPPDARRRATRSGESGAVNDLQDILQVFALYNKKPRYLICPPEVGTRTNEAPRLKCVRSLWPLRRDGRPGILMNSTMDGFIEGCNGGYCYPEKGDIEQPDKTEASHLQDSAQAVMSAYDKEAHPRADKGPKQPRRKRIGEVTKYKVGF